MSKQKILWGATLDASEDGTTFERIAESAGVVVQSGDVEYHDVTSLDSLEGVLEFIPGLIDPGTADLQVGYTPDTYEKLRTWYVGRKLITFKSTFPVFDGYTTGDVFTCTGYVNPKLTETNDVKAPIKISLNIKMSGRPTYTKGTPASP